MANEIVRPKGTASYHNCIKELPGATGGPYPKLVLKKDQPLGLIVRCSCGKLWIIKHFHVNYNEWKEAGWLLRWKHRHEGWEGVKQDEGY